MKAILYVSKTTVVTDELTDKLQAEFSAIPLVIVRANTLPKNAPIELEMLATAQKGESLSVTASSESLTLRDTGSN